MSSLKGTVRSDLNWDKISLNEKHEILLEYITYGFNHLHQEMTIDEFLCPERPNDDNWSNRETIIGCECRVMGLGCGRLKSCKAYQEQKNLQLRHSEIDWNNININSEDLKGIIMMIKKGMIIEPRCENNNSE